MLLESIDDLLLDQLRDLYSSETQIEVALPAIVGQTTSPQLRTALTAHFDETEGQIARLETIFGTLGVRARGPRCLGIAGLLQETEANMRRSSHGGVLDTAVIAGLQRVGQYKMASYASAIAYARALGQDHTAALLAASLDEEAAADQTLAAIAETEMLEQGAQAGVLTE